jgi:hypothetical protein
MSMKLGCELIFGFFMVIAIITAALPFVVPGCNATDRKIGLLLAAISVGVAVVNLLDPFISGEKNVDIAIILWSSSILLCIDILVPDYGKLHD